MQKRKAVRPQKTNPHGSTHEPWIARNFAAVEWRHLVREVLEGRAGQQSLADMLGSFAPSYVRGDYVPTIADAYADLLRVVNARTQEQQLPATAEAPPLTVHAQTIFAGAVGFRVEVRLVPVSTNHNHKTA